MFLAYNPVERKKAQKQGRGVIPDCQVMSRLQDIRTDSDAQLEAIFEMIKME